MNVKSRLSLGDPGYRQLVSRSDELEKQLHNDYPEAFITHKEMSKKIANTKKKLKETEPEFKPLEVAIHKASRAEQLYVLSTKPELAELPKHRYLSEIEIVRSQLEISNDPKLAELISQTAARQSALEARFPQAFAQVDEKVAKRNQARKALNADPEFKRRNSELTAARKEIERYLEMAAPELVELEATAKTYQEELKSK